MIINYISCYNECEYISYALESIYDYSDYILITEGAFLETTQSLGVDMRSNDGTLELIKNFPDPKKKIITVLFDRSHPQIKQRSYIFNILPKQNFWLHLVDADEVYTQDNLNKIKEAINNCPTDVECLRINSYTFINDFYHYVDIMMPRLYHIKPEFKYGFYSPNHLIKAVDNKNYTKLKEKDHNDIFIHHFAYTKCKERFLQKRAERIQQTGYFKWNMNGAGLIYSPGVNIREYNGDYPSCMLKHPMFGIKK